MSLFLTGTDTGVGKTFVAIQLLRLLRSAGIRSAGMKPICCGDRDDARQLLAVGGEGLTIDQINPIWLRSPIAPAVAAQIERVEIDIDKIGRCFNALSAQFEVVIVEGVGGWLVPIAPSLSVSDLAKNLDLPVVIVAENRLGCLNHVLLTSESVQNRGSKIAGIALNHADAGSDLAQTTNVGELRRLLPDIPVVPVGGTGSDATSNLASLFEQNLPAAVFKKLTQV
ncbi:MAG TPA: dethiobiotin synthase [Chthoniobacterales bacterium]